MKDVDMTCSWNSQSNVYHDGELPIEQREVLERHLASCPECSAQLAELRGLSELFAAEPVIKLSQIGVHRLHTRLQAVTDRGIVRLAGVLSGIAAAIVLVGSFWLARVHESPVAAPPWVNIPMNVDEVAMNDSATPVAQYYLADASQQRSDEQP
jgi:hypothetical protein